MRLGEVMSKTGYKRRIIWEYDMRLEADCRVRRGVLVRFVVMSVAQYSCNVNTTLEPTPDIDQYNADEKKLYDVMLAR